MNPSVTKNIDCVGAPDRRKFDPNGHGANHEQGNHSQCEDEKRNDLYVGFGKRSRSK